MSRRRRRFAKSIRRKSKRGFRGYPLATVALYGPDDKCASKLVVGIILNDSDEVAELKKWHSEIGDLRIDRKLEKKVVEFIRKHKVRSVTMMDRIIGCPHEEGKDYPEGEVCPECPFWAHRNRWTGEIIE